MIQGPDDDADGMLEVPAGPADPAEQTPEDMFHNKQNFSLGSKKNEMCLIQGIIQTFLQPSQPVLTHTL